MRIYPTAGTISPENLVTVVHIKTVQDCSLADTISETEDGGEASILIDICELVHIDEDEKSDEDHRVTSIKKFSEEE